MANNVPVTATNELTLKAGVKGLQRWLRFNRVSKNDNVLYALKAMETSTSEHSFKERAILGLREGAMRGVSMGVILGILRSFRSDHPWYLEFFGSLVVFIVVCSVVCGIGRGVSNRLEGAWVGAILGLFLGQDIGDDLGEYTWVRTENSDGSVTAIGSSSGQPVGIFVGLIIGATIGASIHSIAMKWRTSAADTEIAK